MKSRRPGFAWASINYMPRSKREVEGKPPLPSQEEKLSTAMHKLSRAIEWADCPKCGAPPAEQEVTDYYPTWGDGKVHCSRCGTFVRHWDRD